MRVLIADDDPVLRHALYRQLEKWNFEPSACADGLEVRQTIEREGLPTLALIDWNMPAVDGLTLCREIRSASSGADVYLILITSNSDKADVISGLTSGADDYVVKPFDWHELRARVAIGERTVRLYQTLAARVRELEASASRIRRLSGLLPICSYCKSIRNDGDYWQQLETYLMEHSDAKFTHGMCPPCFETITRSYGLEKEEP